MRKVALVVAALTILALIVAFYPSYVEKPEKDGRGVMAIRMAPELPAPETHSPLEWWKANHMDVVNRGDLTKADCLYCHKPATSCNNCHNYVGVAEISELDALIERFKPIE
jgi:hypothetical protein